MNGKIIRDEPIPRTFVNCGRGKLRFPEWLDLKVSRDCTKGDCIVYPDSPHNRKVITQCKCDYNRRLTGQFADYHFVVRYEIQGGEPVVVVQRIA